MYIGPLSISDLPAVPFDGVWRVLACIPETEESCSRFPRFGDSMMAAPLDPSQWQEIDLSWYKPPILNQGSTSSCFPVGTPILMADGEERPIEEIAPGNTVVTHAGIGIVSEIFERKYTGTMFSIKVKGWGDPLCLTEEHPVAQVDKDGTLSWVPASKIYDLWKSGKRPEVVFRRYKHEDTVGTLTVSDYLSETPIVSDNGFCRIVTARRSHVIKNIITIDETFAELVGLFLAEGSFIRMGGTEPLGLSFTFARHEGPLHQFVKSALKEIFGCDSSLSELSSRESVTNVICLNATLARFFHNFCGEYALHKFVNKLFFRCPYGIKIALIRGWLRGDGEHNPVRIKNRRNQNPRCAAQCDGVTSSEALQRGLFTLALSCGLKPGCSIRKQEEHQNAPARTVCFYSSDIIKIFPEAEEQVRSIGFTDKFGIRKTYRDSEYGAVCRIKNIEKYEVQNCKVYNFEVPGDHSYVANNIVVHNCVGHGTCSGMEMCWLQSGKQLVEFNPFFVYGLINGGRDQGAQISDALLALQQYGICPKGDLPPGVMFQNQFPQQAFTDAKRFRLQQAYHCATFEEICSAISLGFVTPLGIYVGQNFPQVDAEGVAPLPNRGGGGHCILGCGLKKSSRYGWIIKIQNSWGLNFGMSGYCYIRKEHFQSMQPDAFAIQTIMDDPQTNDPGDIPTAG